MRQEIIRADALGRVHIRLDYFDASINRLAAWTMGGRSTLRALLSALLDPRETPGRLEGEGDFSRRLAFLGELKGMPAHAVWDYYRGKRGFLWEWRSWRSSATPKGRNCQRGNPWFGESPHGCAGRISVWALLTGMHGLRVPCRTRNLGTI